MERAQSIDTAKEKGPKPMELSWRLMCVSVASSTMSIQYGYNMWIVYSPTVLMQDFYNITISEFMTDSSSQIFLTAVTIALFPLGGIFGAVAAGHILDRLGRKNSLMISNLLSVVSAILMGCSNLIHAYEYIMFTRLFLGICTAILCSVVPIYLSEISPNSLKGSVMMISQLFVTAGVLLAQILALREILGTKEGWPMLMGLIGIIPGTQVFLVPFYPESPRYLLIQKRDEDKAKKVLQRLRGTKDVNSEIEQLRQEDIFEKSEKQTNSLKVLWSQNLRWQVITIIVLMCGQQLIGASAAYYYTERIYMSTNVGINNVRYISIATTVLLGLSSTTAMFLIDIAGRRVLLLVGFGICTITSAVLAMSLHLQTSFPVMTYISTVAVDTYFVGYTLGPSPVPSVVTVELFFQSSRSSAYAIAEFVHWLLSFIMGVSFLHVETRLGAYSFLIFSSISAATFVYIFKFLPETKKMTLLDIRKAMAVKTGRRIQVKGQMGK
ncbi:solute carrier family 2, facilitated glucose transporter member 5-like [Varanus komodoensis]|uniref:solute carrier family 2, facilitated glucose transporter member 5-like n=1 Tax=Varanus komodoensis TaxID=61221 RepID=UPI001CF7E57E|nr:solute carrier family 2, facilitated glucose transporter member 5-like [Varanus komodoensis]